MVAVTVKKEMGAPVPFSPGDACDLLRLVENSHRFGPGTLETEQGEVVGKGFHLNEGVALTWYPPPAGGGTGLGSGAGASGVAVQGSSSAGPSAGLLTAMNPDAFAEVLADKLMKAMQGRLSRGPPSATHSRGSTKSHSPDAPAAPAPGDDGNLNPGGGDAAVPVGAVSSSNDVTPATFPHTPTTPHVNNFVIRGEASGTATAPGGSGQARLSLDKSASLSR